MSLRDTDLPLHLGRGMDLGMAPDPDELEALRLRWALVDNVGVGVFSVDGRTGRVIDANPAFARILGFASVRDAVGSTMLELCDDPEEWAETFSRFLAGPALREHGTIRFEAVRVRRDSGTPVHVLMTVSVLLDEDGNMRRVDGMLEDIGERNRVEKAFRASERRFRRLFEDAAVGMVIATPELVITRVNQSFRDLLGYAEGELPRMRLEQLRHPDEQQVPLPAPGDERRHGGQQWCFVSKSGAKVWGIVTATWMLSDGGEPLHVVLMVQNVTYRKRLEEELARAEKLESLGVLAGGIAHEFNNALSAILGNVGLAAVMSQGNDDLERALDRASRAVERARGLTSRLLTFASGGHPVKKAESVPALLNEAMSHCSQACRAVVRFEIQPGLPDANLDAAQMVQAFTNLIINGVEAAPEGTLVTVSATEVTLDLSSGLPLPAGRYVRVTITDQGAGISTDHLSRVFSPFFSTKSSTGLGLATAYSVVKRHGGLLTLASEVGVGSTFAVYLAASVDSVALDEVCSTPVVRGRILVMDDDLAVREVTTAMLSACGLEGDVASDGLTALSMFVEAAHAGRPYAAVILDLTVPGGLGGAEIIGRLLEVDPEVRAIVSSGYSASPVFAEYRRYGFVGVLPKPYTFEDFRRTLHKVLEP